MSFLRQTDGSKKKQTSFKGLLSWKDCFFPTLSVILIKDITSPYKPCFSPLNVSYADTSFYSCVQSYMDLERVHIHLLQFPSA